MSYSLAPTVVLHPPRARDAARLSTVERTALAIGIFEIPLQFDKYFFFQEVDALMGSVGGVNFSLTTLSLIFLYCNWFASAAVLPRSRSCSLCLGLPMVVYLVANLLSLTVAASPLLAAFDLALLLQAYLLFFFLANRLVTLADLNFVLWLIAGVVATQSLAIMALSALGSAAHGAEYHVGPIDLTVGEDGRPEGTLRSPTGAGSVLYLLTTVACPLVFIEPLLWRRRLVAGVVVGGMFAIALTQTRGAIATAVVAALLLAGAAIFYGWVPRKAIGAMLVVGALMALPISAAITQRVLEGGLDSAMSRVHLSAIAFEMLAADPLFGVGAGNSHRAAMQYANQAEFRSEWFYTIHCKYLLVWVETGLLGLGAFLCMLGAGLRQAVRAWASRDSRLKAIGFCLVVGLAGHMAHLWVDVFNSRPQVQTLWLVLALCSATGRLSDRERLA